jgi:lipoprotein signal peptidase
VVPAIRADRSRLGRVVAIAAVVVVLDQITKLIVLNRLVLGVPVVLVDGFFALTLVMNTGLAFGLLSGSCSAWRCESCRAEGGASSPRSASFSAGRSGT